MGTTTGLCKKIWLFYCIAISENNKDKIKFDQLGSEQQKKGICRNYLITQAYDHEVFG